MMWSSTSCAAEQEVARLTIFGRVLIPSSCMKVLPGPRILTLTPRPAAQRLCCHTTTGAHGRSGGHALLTQCKSWSPMHAWLDLHAAQRVAGGPAGDAHVVCHLVAAGALQEDIAPRGRGRVGDHAAVARRLRGRALRLVAEQQRRALRAVRPRSLPAPRPLRPLRHGRMHFGAPVAGRARELVAPGPSCARHHARTQLSAAQQQRSVAVHPSPFRVLAYPSAETAA